MLELGLAFLNVSSCKGLLKLFNLHHHVGWCLYSLYPLNVACIDWIWNYTLEGFLVYFLLVWSLEAIFIIWPQCRNPTFGKVWKWHSHSRNGDLGILRDSQKFQSSIARVKTPRLEAFFMSLKSYWSVDVENGLAWAIWSWPDPGVCRWSATHCWKALNES
jgi:hypothetical protein